MTTTSLPLYSPMATQSSILPSLRRFIFHRLTITVLLGVILVFLLVVEPKSHGDYIQAHSLSVDGSESLFHDPDLPTSGYVCIDALTGKKFPSHLKYACVFDAGSTGTRVHVYALTYCRKEPVALYKEIFQEVPIGLSKMTDRVTEVASALIDPLVKICLENVPPSLVPVTPLSLKATAGLRLLPDEQVTLLLGAVRSSLRNCPFRYSPEKDVSVISGLEEGVWGWITVNFLLNKIGFLSTTESDVADLLLRQNPESTLLSETLAVNSADGSTSALDTSASGRGDANSASVIHTAAIMDLGGASTQLVYEMDAGDILYFKHHIETACKTRAQSETSTVPNHPHSNVNPDNLCISLKDLIVHLDFGGKQYTLFQHSFLGYGLMEARRRLATCELCTNAPENSSSLKIASDGACHRAVRSLFPLNDACPVFPCAFAGVPLPSSLHHIDNLVAFSYFYDRLTPHFPSALTVSLDSIQQLSEKLCSVKDDQCSDIMYIRTLLSDGYGLSGTKEISLVKKINGVETCWALGAALDLLATS